MGPMAGRWIAPAVMICSPLNNIPRHYTFADTTFSVMDLSCLCKARVYSVRLFLRGGEVVLLVGDLLVG